MSRARTLFAVGLVAALGCDEPAPAVRPITIDNPRVQPPPPSAELVDPGMRTRQTAEQAAAERERLGVTEDGSGGGARPRAGGAGGGGGGGAPSSANAAPWVPPAPAGAPTSREVEAFRREFAAAMEREVNPDADPCTQLRETASASAMATERASRDADGRPPVPGRDAFRRGCREMREEMQRCLERRYFQEHAEECQRELARLARAGERASEDARDALAELEQRPRAP
ncbi:MAG: hypothetical protein KF729_05895 [Sandaracinaceae bacterium]|nr:hypothetical protein [Sandaracinaceae bacterium]